MATHTTVKTIKPSSDTELSFDKLKVTEQGKYIKLEITKTNPNRIDSILVPKDSYKNLLNLVEESYYRFFEPTKHVNIEKIITIE